MPLLIAIDISLTNLMLMGLLTNTQKNTSPIFYIHYNKKEIFFFPQWYPSAFSLLSILLCEKSLGAGCLSGLGWLALNQSTFSKAVSACSGLTIRTYQTLHWTNKNYLDLGHGGISSSTRWREKRAWHFH